MKKILFVLIIISITFTGISLLYFEKDNKPGQNENIIKEKKNSNKNISLVKKTFKRPLDSISKTKSNDYAHCFNYECAYNQYLDMLEW